MKKLFVLFVLVSIVLAACGSTKATSAPATRDPLVEQLATQVVELQQLVQATATAQPTIMPVVVVPNGAASLLTADGTPKGYFIILYKDGPAEVSVPEGGFTFVALGNGKVGSVSVLSDGTVGNVVLFMGTNPDGSTPADLNDTIVVDDYTVGHVGVTTIWFGEDGHQTALNAVAGMFSAPNCGAEGCNTVYLYIVWPDGSVEKETFTDPPG